MSPIKKTFITADSLFTDSFRLAKKIYDSGYRPDVILVLWRGGTPVGIVVHEFLLLKGIKSYHTAIKAESYTGIGKRMPPVIENLKLITKNIKKNACVLVIDDIFDTGKTMDCVRKALKYKTRNVKTSALYLRGDTKSRFLPDFYMRETFNWIVFPHELIDLTKQEIKKKGTLISKLVHDSKNESSS